MPELDITSGLFLKFSMTVVYNLIQMSIVRRHNKTTRTNVSSFFIIAVVVFFLSYVLSTFEMQIGLAIGMFAIFGIVRYRTEPLRPQEMTYLFASLGVAVINALSTDSITLVELVLINGTVLGCIYILERFMLEKPSETKSTTKKVSLVVPSENLSEQVVEDRVGEFAKNMGVVVVKHHISKIDHAEGKAQIIVVYEV